MLIIPIYVDSSLMEYLMKRYKCIEKLLKPETRDRLEKGLEYISDGLTLVAAIIVLLPLKNLPFTNLIGGSLVLVALVIRHIKFCAKSGSEKINSGAKLTQAKNQGEPSE